MDVADIDAAHELAGILQDDEAEMQAFQTGASNATDFEAAVTVLVGEAQELIAELDAVNAQRFGGVIGALGRIVDALNTAATQAANLAQACRRATRRPLRSPMVRRAVGFVEIETWARLPLAPWHVEVFRSMDSALIRQFSER